MSRARPDRDFPAQIALRVIGPSGEAGFEQRVLAIIDRHVSKEFKAEISRRPSRENRWVSLSVRMTLHSREQLDRLYAELSADEQVVMVL